MDKRSGKRSGGKKSHVDVGSASLKEEGDKYGGVFGAATGWKRVGKGYTNMAPQVGGYSCERGKENKTLVDCWLEKGEKRVQTGG